MKINGLSVVGQSVSGNGTCLVIPEYKVALDIGYPLPQALGCPTVLVTHTHVDHIASIAWHGFTRSLLGGQKSRYIVPRDSIDKVYALLEAFWAVNNSKFDCEVQGLAPGERLYLRQVQPQRHLYVEAFETDHRQVPSQGYMLWQEKPKLKDEYKGRPGQELAKLKEEGVEIEAVARDLEVVYTGDTRISIWAEHPEFQDVTKLIITECTFLEDRDDEEADRKGHTSLAQLKVCPNRPPEGKLLLTHFSMRYAPKDVMEGIGGFAYHLSDGLSE